MDENNVDSLCKPAAEEIEDPLTELVRSGESLTLLNELLQLSKAGTIRPSRRISSARYDPSCPLNSLDEGFLGVSLPYQAPVGPELLEQ